MDDSLFYTLASAQGKHMTEEKNKKSNFQPADQDITKFTPEVRELEVDVISKPTKIIILAQIPGVKKNEVDIVIDKDLLKIRANQICPIETSDADNILASECRWGEVFRPIILPTGLDTRKVTARMEEGLLQIEIPKSDEMRIRKIKIN